VRNSRPQRHGLPTDKIRNTSTFVAFLVLILCLVLPIGVRLDWGGVLLIVYYLITDAITYDQVLKACKPAILTTIAAAIAFGTALSKTGVINLIAETMINAVSELGTAGIVTAVYICAVALSMVINNSATVAILGTMLTAIVRKQPEIHIEGLLWCLTYSAGSCFTTPLGYQTNLMVMADGKYTFGDFARFGIFIQLLHMVFTVTLVVLLTPPLVGAP
jgi:di/tricarboxylate transporter